MTEANSKESAIKIILDVCDLMERIGFGKGQAGILIMLCDLYNHRALRLESWVYKAVESMSPATLKRWRKPTRQRGQGKRGSGSFAKDTFCHGQANYLLTRYSDVTAARVFRLIEEKLTIENEWLTAPKTIPSKRTVERYVRDWRKLESILPERELQCKEVGGIGYDAQKSLALFRP